MSNEQMTIEVEIDDEHANAAAYEAWFCECGASHSIEEIDSNQCDCCGKPIDD